MAIRVIFNKPDGFITVIRGSKTWLLSKEEANSVFVSTVEIQTLLGRIGTLFTAFLSLIPLEQRKNIRYEVKIVTKLGEEVLLLKSRNVESAEDMVNRIIGFTRGETNNDGVPMEEPFASARRAKRKNSYKVAGVLEIICSPLVFLQLSYVYYGLGYEGWYKVVNNAWILFVIIALVPMVGGIFALKRKKWWVALVGAIVSLIFWWLGIFALIFIIESKKEEFEIAVV
jgi:hypothetical protein